jgi:GH15 family glucan-1,4-alpha-glucosidase
VSNGSTSVGLGHDGQVHDFYYPYVGLENHTSGSDLFHRVGIWVDGQVSWLNDDGWKISFEYDLPVLAAKVKAINDELKISLETYDFVDHQYNVFARRISVKNQSDSKRDIRLFINQVFRIADSQRDDTAQFLPQHHAVLH